MGFRLFWQIPVMRRKNASRISRPCTMHTSTPNKRDLGVLSVRTIYKAEKEGGMNPAPTLPGSLRFTVGAVCGLRNAVALALLPERLAGQAEELCGFGLVVLRPLQRFEDVLPLELLPGGVQPIHQRRSLVHHGRPFAAKPARRLRRAPEIQAG